MSDKENSNPEELFLNLFSKKQKIIEKRNKNQGNVIEMKKRRLFKVKKLLDKFKDMEIVVLIQEKLYMSNYPLESIPEEAKIAFNYQVIESSPTWAPGVSLYIRDPIELEIAIPNDYDIEERGVIEIAVSSEHKDSGLFTTKFASIEDANNALAKFFAKNTIEVRNLPENED